MSVPPGLSLPASRAILVEADGREGAAVLASLGWQVARVSPQEVVRQTTRDIPRELRNGTAQLLYVAFPLRRDLAEAAAHRFMDITAEWAKVAKASDVPHVFYGRSGPHWWPLAANLTHTAMAMHLLCYLHLMDAPALMSKAAHVQLRGRISNNVCDSRNRWCCTCSATAGNLGGRAVPRAKPAWWTNWST